MSPFPAYYYVTCSLVGLFSLPSLALGPCVPLVRLPFIHQPVSPSPPSQSGREENFLQLIVCKKKKTSLTYKDTILCMPTSLYCVDYLYCVLCVSLFPDRTHGYLGEAEASLCV